MQKEVVIIAEGPQGVGKTTVTNWLREQIPYSNLCRMTGTRYTGAEAYPKMVRQHGGMMSYIMSLTSGGINFILDRFYFTEQVYSILGYNSNNFDSAYKRLNEDLLTLRYDVYLLNLYCSDEELLRARLQRDKPQYQTVQFNLNNTLQQADLYKRLFEELKDANKHINIVNVDTRDEEVWKKQLTDLFHEMMR